MPQSDFEEGAEERGTDAQAGEGTGESGIAALLSNLPGMAYRCRNDARLTVLFVSEGCRDLLGYASEQFFGSNAIDYNDVVLPEDRNAAREGLRVAVAERRRYNLRYRVRTAGGPVKWVSDCGRGVLAANGDVETIVGFAADITELKRAEEELREHNEMRSLGFRHARDMLLLARVEPGPIFRVESVNRRYLEVVRAAGFEATAEGMVGKTFDELQRMFGFPDEIWEMVLARYQLVAEKRESMDFDEVTQTPRGTFYGESTIAPICDVTGECRLVLYSSSNVTDRKRAEVALRDSEEKFAKVFRAVPDAVFVTEMTSGRVVDVNGGCERVYGYKAKECIGRTTQELGIFSDPDARDRLMELLRQQGGAVRDLEIRGRARDGREVDALVSCETIELNGEPHLVTIAHDLTARKRAERALRESEAKFSTAFQASPGAMCIIELDTRRFVEVNQDFCQLLGFSRDELIGRTPVDLGLWINEEDRRRFFERLLSDGLVRDLEVLARHRDGHAITCLVNARAVEFSGRTTLITSLHDLTERKRAEESRAALEGQLRQAQKLDALGQLAGGIAHDFNNILTGIIAYSGLAITDAEQPAEVKKHLTTVLRAADRAADLVRQILTFSRKHARERKPLQLAPIVAEAVKLLRSSLPKSIVLEERIERNAPPVLADATQIQQIVLNLCTNAAHAMRQMPGRLGVSLERVDLREGDHGRPAGLEPGGYARLSVSDTGEGMEAEILGRVFEPFFTTKSPGEGTGLGLSVVHGIVKEHDGSIFVRSRPGEGTLFEIYLPEHELVPELPEGEAVSPPTGTGQHILFVDDEAVIVGAATIILQRLGYRVSAHTDPRRALVLFESNPDAFDLVVTDLTMPGLDGVELSRRVLATRRDLPVLLTTGQGGALTAEQVRALGLRGLLMKPLSQAKLIRAIGEALANAS